MLHAYIGLGSNQHEPLLQLQAAVSAIALLKDVYPQKVSSVYCGPFVGGASDIAHADVYNAVLLAETTLEPQALLEKLQSIELQQGRIREGVCGDRAIDLDLLLYAEYFIDTSSLQLPHPRMLQRAFVMYPLGDITADLLLWHGLTVRDVCATLNDTALIKTEHSLHIPNQYAQNT